MVISLSYLWNKRLKQDLYIVNFNCYNFGLKINSYKQVQILKNHQFFSLYYSLCISTSLITEGGGRVLKYGTYGYLNTFVGLRYPPTASEKIHFFTHPPPLTKHRYRGAQNVLTYFEIEYIK